MLGCTFFQLFYLFSGEGGPVSLQLPLQPQPHLRVLIAGGVVVRVPVGGGLGQAVAHEVVEAYWKQVEGLVSLRKF